LDVVYLLLATITPTILDVFDLVLGRENVRLDVSGNPGRLKAILKVFAVLTLYKHIKIILAARIAKVDFTLYYGSFIIEKFQQRH